MRPETVTLWRAVDGSGDEPIVTPSTHATLDDAQQVVDVQHGDDAQHGIDAVVGGGQQVVIRGLASSGQTISRDEPAGAALLPAAEAIPGVAAITRTQNSDERRIRPPTVPAQVSSQT